MEDSKEIFFNMFDLDLSKTMNAQDVKWTMDRQYSEFNHDYDAMISKKEWDTQTARVFSRMCSSAQKIGKMNLFDGSKVKSLF